jgi:hypothetical protein
VKHSLMHRSDAVLARISYVAFPVYILFMKNISYKMKALFLILFFASLFMIYWSDVFSRKEWCCRQHVMCHSVFHVLISMGCSIAFV